MANIFVPASPMHTGIPVHRNTFARKARASASPNSCGNFKKASSIEYTSISTADSRKIDITRADISPYKV